VAITGLRLVGLALLAAGAALLLVR
jgi:hypothetical protein